jgi:hypothetical protein
MTNTQRLLLLAIGRAIAVGPWKLNPDALRETVHAVEQEPMIAESPPSWQPRVEALIAKLRHMQRQLRDEHDCWNPDTQQTFPPSAVAGEAADALNVLLPAPPEPLMLDEVRRTV